MSGIFPEPSPQPKSFIPDADLAFADMAEAFAATIASNPERFMLDAGIAELLTNAARQFREALGNASGPSNRTPVSTDMKKQVRASTEKIVRKYGAIIRVNPDIPAADKLALGIHERPTRLAKRTIPSKPPVLTYHGPGVEATLGAEMHCTGSHILKFHTELASGSRAKPRGVARVEIFVELVPPGEKIPKHPAERTGRPWFLRSFTTSRMEVAFPMPSEPMLVVYWARWASSTGEFGRFSRTCIARQEGWTSKQPSLPEAPGDSVRRVETKYVFIQTPIAGELPGDVEGDEVADEIAALGSRMLEAATARLLDAA